MSEDPDTLTSVFCSLQFFDQESDTTTVIWIGRVAMSWSANPMTYSEMTRSSHVVQVVASVPEVGVQGDDSQLGVCWVVDTVGSIMHTCLGSCGSGDPSVVLPERSNMIIVPRSARALVLVESSKHFKTYWKPVGCINGLC